MRIDRLGLEHLPLLVPLFDAYRVWYGNASDTAAAAHFLANRLERDESVVFGAFDDDQLIAFTQLYPSFSSVSMGRIWVLNDLFVVETHRGRGAGLALMERARNHAAQSGAVRIDLETGETNERAQRLYEGLGYTMDPAFRHYSLSL